MSEWLLDAFSRAPVLFIIIAINVVLFLLMGIDKLLAKGHIRRIPERVLFLFALLFGAIGGCLGMWLFRHKTRHAKFSFGFPLLALLDIVALYFIYTTDWQAFMGKLF